MARKSRMAVVGEFSCYDGAVEAAARLGHEPRVVRRVLDNNVPAVLLGPFVDFSEPSGRIARELAHLPAFERVRDHGANLLTRDQPVLTSFRSLPAAGNEQIRVSPESGTDKGGRVAGIGAVEAKHDPSTWRRWRSVSGLTRLPRACWQPCARRWRELVQVVAAELVFGDLVEPGDDALEVDVLACAAIRGLDRRSNRCLRREVAVLVGMLLPVEQEAVVADLAALDHLPFLVQPANQRVRIAAGGRNV